MINRLPEDEEFDPELGRYYEWRYNHYELQERCRSAFWRRFEKWADSWEGQEWLERARTTNAGHTLVSVWRTKPRRYPHRLDFVRICRLFGWSVTDFWPELRIIETEDALRRLFPRGFCSSFGRSPILAPEYRARFKAALEVLWTAEPTPERKAASELRGLLDWIYRIQSGRRTNIAPDMLRAFCRSIGRSPVKMVAPYGRPPKTDVLPSSAAEEPTPAPAPAPEPTTPPAPEPVAYSFFAGCA